MGILNLPPHNNPPEHHDPQRNRRSTAPYNFIPLPETVVTLSGNDPEKLPSHDNYVHEFHPHTGYFDVMLTTQSPLYVRGMLTRAEFDLNEQGLDRHGLDEKGKDQQGNQVREGATPLVDRLKNKPDFFHTGDAAKPVIPGSSLRGMLRSLVEIVSYSKVGRVADKKLIYRAVGDTTALGDWYREQMLGPNQTDYPNLTFDYPQPQLKGGYLCKHQGEWAIRPAVEHQGESFVHVDYQRARSVIGGEGRQVCHEVYVTPPAARTAPNRGRRGRGDLTLNLAVTTGIASRTAPKPAGMEEAVLVKSGHMGKPWGRPADPHQKHMHCAIYAPNDSAPPIPIPPGIWQAYEEDREFKRGIPARKLENPGDPLFYLMDSQGKALIFFGPTMMFRLPYSRSVRAMIPEQLKQPLAVDFGDALFGFVREKSHFKTGQPLPAQGEKARAYSSRVQISDAELTEQYTGNQLWLVQPNLALPLRILSTPKPTSFQHYLIQQEAAKPELNHYDSPTENAEGQEKGQRSFIRGVKRYWPQGDKTIEDLRLRMPMEELRISTQNALVRPVRSGVRFRFRVYFENLSNAELGALCWALHPLGVEGKTYCHQLGMGKPLGMGAVTLDATLQLNQRKARYESLFAGNRWVTGDETEPPLSLAAGGERLKIFTGAFEQEVLEQLGKPCARLSQLKRIAMLLKMMDWEDRLPDAEVETQSLEDFRQRRVLPDPSAWIANAGSLAMPQPTEEPIVSDVSRPDSQRQTPSSGIGNFITLPTSPQPLRATISKSAGITLEDVVKTHEDKKGKSVQPLSGEKRMLVTLLTAIAGGKAQVQVEGSEQPVACKNFGYAPGVEAGVKCWANVRYDKGNPISATFLKWQ